jgi:hypothetical protein
LPSLDSRTIATISSTNSGFPSAASQIRSRSASSTAVRLSIRVSVSSGSSGSRSTLVAFAFPTLQPGRRSSRSGLAMQSSRIGASCDRRAT